MMIALARYPMVVASLSMSLFPLSMALAPPLIAPRTPMFTLKARGFFDFRAAFLGHADDADF